MIASLFSMAPHYGAEKRCGIADVVDVTSHEVVLIR
jgi:hypothetical protein